MELPFFTTTAGSSSTTSQGEALRWLAIAEKLLHGRDLVGSKSFAARAREADPTLLYADQIIAVADTLVAGDKRINNQPDWYSILQIAGSQTRDAELINSQYRKLTFLLNPQKNRLPYADQAFNLVLNAWSVLSNSSSKTLYDNELMAAHSSVIPPSSGFNNPIFSGVTREQMNYQPFEINFQVMPQQQQQQQSVVREQVSQMLPLHSMNRERLSQQFPPQNVNLEQVGHPFPQLHLSRDQVQQPQPQLQPQQQPQPQLQPQQQPQPQLRPEPQLQQPRRENWMGGNATDAFSGGSGAHNQNVNASDQGGNLNNAFENAEGSEVIDDNRNKGSSDDPNLNFWTACPYCYYMYEYPKVYAECILQCQNKKCRKAFHGVVIPKPPSTVEGKDAYFCCWGIMPMGISMTTLDRHRGFGGNWTPFSPMFSLKGSGNITNAGNANLFGSRNANDDAQGSKGGNTGGRNASGPRVYVDDDDVFLEYSDSGGESDTEWQRNGGKRSKGGRRRVAAATPTQNVQKAHIDKDNIVNTHDNDNVSDGFVPQESARISAASVTEPVKKGTADSRKKGVSESIKKGAVANSRRQSARGSKNFGSLDLNVEFSNETEEPLRRVSHYSGPGRGEEDIIEGGGFFEGLDEFLSSLPISMSEG